MIKFNPDISDTDTVKNHALNMRAFIESSKNTDSESVQDLIRRFDFESRTIRAMVKNGLSPDTPYAAISDLLRTQYAVVKAELETRHEGGRTYTVKFARYLAD